MEQLAQGSQRERLSDKDATPLGYTHTMSSDSFAAWLLSQSFKEQREREYNWARNEGNIQVAVTGQMHAAMHHRSHQPEF